MLDLLITSKDVSTTLENIDFSSIHNFSKILPSPDCASKSGSLVF